MPFKDLRQYMDTLRRTGDLVTVERKVDWNLEAGAINRRSYEMKGPAILFNNIKNYSAGYRILAGPFGTFRRVAISLGLHPDTPVNDIQYEYERRNTPIKPIALKSGPCKENIMKENEVDIYKFPAPMIHMGDGGRYICTWGITAFKDPGSNWMNWGVYRFMVHSEKHLVGMTRDHSHLGITLREKCIPNNRPLPVAIFFGGEPLCHMAAATSYPPGIDEVDYAGGLGLNPVLLTKCETSDLLVPASAEIVIEGEILPDKTTKEGPFGEYSGYQPQEPGLGILCRIKTITFRNDPILPMISVGVADDHDPIISITAATAIKKALKKRGIPVTNVHVPPGIGLHIAVVGVESGGSSMAEKILETLTKRRAMMSKIIVVDKDVDVFNLDQVLQAFAVKCHPVNGILAKPLSPGVGNISTPCFSIHEKAVDTGAIAVLDCTWPIEWPKETLPVRCSFNDVYPEEVKRQVLKNWHKYGL